MCNRTTVGGTASDVRGRCAGKSGRRAAMPSPPSRRAAFPLRILRSRPVLLFAFSFAVMGDPVSSVAYAIEAALRALDGDLDLLLPTMALVIGIIALVIVNYWFLVAPFPGGGGAAPAAGQAFGAAGGFPPM